eukprot:364479-Chlamydomonas_euryale.AAC.17
MCMCTRGGQVQGRVDGIAWHAEANLDGTLLSKATGVARVGRKDRSRDMWAEVLQGRQVTEPVGRGAPGQTGHGIYGQRCSRADRSRNLWAERCSRADRSRNLWAEVLHGRQVTEPVGRGAPGQKGHGTCGQRCSRADRSRNLWAEVLQGRQVTEPVGEGAPGRRMCSRAAADLSRDMHTGHEPKRASDFR